MTLESSLPWTAYAAGGCPKKLRAPDRQTARLPRIQAGSWGLILSLLISLCLGCQEQPQGTAKTRPTSNSGSGTPGSGQSPPLPQASSRQIKQADKPSSTKTPPGPATKESKQKSQPQAQTPQQPSQPKDSSETTPPTMEFWDAYLIQGSHVGYSRTRIWQLEEQGQAVIKEQIDSQMTIKRLGQTLVQKMVLASTETSRGALIRCFSQVSAGGGDMTMTGKVFDHKLVMETSSLGKTSRSEIPWPTGGGFFVADQSLMQHPMTPGEKRMVRGLLPLINQVGQTDLEALDYETVELLEGPPQKLLKIRSNIKIGPGGLETFLWINEKGHTVKSLVPGMKQETYRTTRERAMQKSEAAELDLMVASVVRVKGQTQGLTSARRVIYSAKLKTGKIEGMLAPGLGQLLRSEKDSKAEIEVRVATPEMPKKLDTVQNEPAEKDLVANNYIQSDDARVKKLAAELGPESEDAWKVAKAAESLVHSKIRRKDFSQAFATAAEVARNLEGDCTEHAVLLAAVCRARKIPARVCIGLVHVPGLRGFAFHAWNEVWVKDRWVPLDATLGRGFVPPDHIKLADTNLDGGNAYAAVLPVVRAMGQLELEVVSIE